MSNTRDRILETALELFNEQGTAPVSTNHIAEALGISPGNLYYHFRNKEQIVRALFEQLFGVWDAIYDLPADRPPALEDLRHLVHETFRMMHQFRFVYRELGALLRRDGELSRRYTEIRRRGFEGFRQLFAAFAAAGVLKSTSRDDVDRLAELCWLIGDFWLPNLELSGSPVDEPNMRRGEDLMLALLQLYASSSEKG